MKNKVILVIIIILFMLQCYFLGIKKEDRNDIPEQTLITTTTVETTVNTTISTTVTSITTVTTEPIIETTVSETEITTLEIEPVVEMIEEPVVSYVVYKLTDTVKFIISA